MAECKHLMEESACGDCRPEPLSVQVTVLHPEYGPWFPAGYDGECAGCGGDILAGDQIRADGQGGWLCEDCGQDDPSEVNQDAAVVPFPGEFSGYPGVPDPPAARFLATLSDGQREALDAIVKWHGDGGPVPLILGGLAGTGKTSLAALLPQVLPEAEIAYCAYTGKAVQVLRSKLDALGVRAAQVSTIHRLLYRPVAVTICTDSGQLVYDGPARCGLHLRRESPCPARHQVSFTPVPDPLDGLDLVVADEASMIPEKLWRDLTAHDVPVLAVGDHGQLPPVQSAFSLMASPDLRLEEIHRQNAADPAGMAILNVARWAREQGHIPHGWYGPDVVKIGAHEIGYAGLHPGDADMILCATNATRAWHNTAMRTWHGRSGPPQAGDVVICLRNNYDEGLFNGQRGIIRETGASLDAGGYPAVQMAIVMEGLDEPWEGAVATGPFGQPPEAAREIRDRDLALFDYGYALTVHKSQGSGADKVLVIEEGWPPAGTEMRARWLYTAVSRASKALTVAGWLHDRQTAKVLCRAWSAI